MDLEDIKQKVKQARKDRDVNAIEKIIRSVKNRDEKKAIMRVLVGYNKPAVEPKLGVTSSENFQKADAFSNEVSDLYARLSAEDPDIKNCLETNSQQFLELEVYGKLGSGDKMRPLNYYVCSNTDPSQDKYCQNQGNLQCGQCGLVAYCSKSCQVEHWKVHKKICQDSEFLSDGFKPFWVKRNRNLPFIITKSSKQQMAGFKARIWGYQPAFDLIGFKRNEQKDGSIWKEPVNIAFVAGDFRSMVETLASVPDDYQQPITIVLNDKDPAIVGRNLFMLGLLLMKGEKALDLVIAIWYSAAMTQYQHVTTGDFLMSLWSAGNRLEEGLSSIELNQMGTAINIIESMISMSLEINKVEMLDARSSIMLNDTDYLDPIMLALKDYQRDSVMQYLAMGLLLPYFNDKYVLKDCVNPFLLSPGLGWLVDVTCDPKQVWSMLEVMKFGDEKGLPKNDLHGRLFFYVKDRLSRMLSTMQRLPVKVRMFQKDPKVLAKQLKSIKFDRIDITNSPVEGNLGIEKMLNIWGPLLNKDNPHSAIITLSHNWHHSITKSAQIPSEMDPDSLSKMISLIGLDRAGSGLHDMNDPTNKLLIQHAAMAFGDHSEEFEKYMKKIEEKKPNYLKRRMDHTIVPHQVMFPIEAKPNTTIESLPENDQYWVFNCTFDPTDRYSEWTLDEQ